MMQVRTVFLSFLLVSSEAGAQSSLFLPQVDLGSATFSSWHLEQFRLWSPEAVFSVIPGTQFHEGRALVRGRASWDFGTTINGFDVTDNMRGGHKFSIIPEATEQAIARWNLFDVHSIGLRPQSVDVEMKYGGDQRRMLITGSTDGFGSGGSRIANTTIQGEHRLVGVLSGPVVEGLNGQIAAEFYSIANKTPMYLVPFGAAGLRTDALGYYPDQTPLPGEFEFKENFLPDNGMDRISVQTNATYDLSSTRLEMLGLHESSSAVVGNEWPFALHRVFSRRRAMTSKVSESFVGFRGTMPIVESANLTLSAGYSRRSDKLVDPDFGEDWMRFSDSLQNAQKGYTGFTSRFSPPPSYSVIFNFPLEHENSPNTFYSKGVESSVQAEGRLDITLGDGYSISAGLRYQSASSRRFTIIYIPGYLRSLLGGSGMDPVVFPDEQTKRSSLQWDGGVSNYGFTYDGNETDGDVDMPFSPHDVTGYASFERNAGSTTFAAGLLFVLPQLDLGMRDAEGRSMSEPRSSASIFPRARITTNLMPGLSLDGGISGSFSTHPLQPMYDLYGSPWGVSDFVLNPLRRLPYTVNTQLPFPRQFKTYVAELAVTGTGEHGRIRAGLTYRADIETPADAGGMSTMGIPIPPTFQQFEGRSVLGWEVLGEYSPIDAIAVQAWYLSESVNGDRSSSSAVAEHNARFAFAFDSAPETAEAGDGICVSLSCAARSGLPYTKIVNPQNTGTSTAWKIGVRYLADARGRVPDGSISDERSPWITNVDLSISYGMAIADAEVTFLIQVQNLLDEKAVRAVYQTTGKHDDDGWLASPFSSAYRDIPLYEDFYRAINLANHWAYSTVTGKDMFGTPRRVQAGVRVRI